MGRLTAARRIAWRRTLNLLGVVLIAASAILGVLVVLFDRPGLLFSSDAFARVPWVALALGALGGVMIGAARLRKPPTSKSAEWVEHFE